MRRLLLLAIGIFALNANVANATTFVWSISGNYTEVCVPAGNPGCTNGATSTYTGQIVIDPVAGTGTSPPSNSLLFVGIQNGDGTPGSLNFSFMGGVGAPATGTCNSVGTCYTSGFNTDFLPWGGVPAGTTFELMMCANACQNAGISYWIFDVKANGGVTSLVGFTGGTIIGGVEIGGSCGATGPNSGETCGIITAASSGGPSEPATPLPAALPLFAGGLGVLGLLARRRKRKNASTLAAA
jgi:hypothetical protein